MLKKNGNVRMGLFIQVSTFFILVVVGIVLFLPSVPALPIEKILFAFMLTMLILNFNMSCFFTRSMLNMERQSGALNSSLENLNASCVSIDKQLVHLSQVHTRELKETLEQRAQALDNELGAIAEQLKPFSHTHAKMWIYLEKATEALKTLERDLIIVSDVMEKNAKICLKQSNGSCG